MKTPILIALGAFLATAAVIKAAPALAEPVPAQDVSVVHTADLDLNTQTGRSELNHRLTIAAYEVCGEAAEVDLVGQNAVRACRRDVLARARDDSRLMARRGSVIVAASR